MSSGLEIIIGLGGMVLWIIGFGSIQRGLLAVLALFALAYVLVYGAHGLLLTARGVIWLVRMIRRGSRQA